MIFLSGSECVGKGNPAVWSVTFSSLLNKGMIADVAGDIQAYLLLQMKQF